MSTPRVVILDVDGTLIDSNTAHAQAWLDALHEVGIDVPLDRVRKMIGMGGDKLLPKAIGLDPEGEPGKQASKRRGEIFMEKYFPTVRPFPDARELLERMKSAGLELTIASSAKPDELEAMLDKIGVRDLIAKQTSGSDGRSKPDPDTVEGVLVKAGARPEEAIMIGDTPYDIEGAGKAGVQAVALRSGGWDEPELSGAIALYDDPADLLARFDSSPFVDPTRGDRRVTGGEVGHQEAMSVRAVGEAKQS